MAIGEFQPDLRPAWATSGPSGAEPTPVLDSDGVQKMVPQPTHHQLPWPGDASVSLISATTWFSLSKGWDDSVSGHVWFIGSSGGSPAYLHDEDFTLAQDVRKGWQLPPGTDKVSVALNPHAHPVGWCFEVRGQ